MGTLIRRLPGGALTVATLLVTLGGCYVSLGTSQPPDEREVVLLSLISEGVMRPGDLVEISIALPEDDPETPAPRSAEAGYTVHILLQDTEGEEITQIDFPYTDGDELPPLTLDDLELATDWYRLTVSLHQGDRIIGQKSVDFTYLGGEYGLEEVTSDASLVHPGSTVSLTASVAAPQGADPVLVWSVGGEPFAEGTVSEGLDHALWTAPLDTGIYTVSVLLYPPGFRTAAEGLETVVYVAPVENPRGNLGPKASYRALYHLVGDLEDAGTLGERARFLNDTPLRLLTRGEWVGYRLDGIGGLAVDRLLLPEVDGMLGPFSITVGYTPDQPTALGGIAAMTSRDGTFALRLGFGPDAVLRAEMVLSQVTYRVAAKVTPVDPDTRYEIGFSLYPAAVDPGTPPAMEAVLFLDGREIAREVWPAVPDVGSEGMTIVGGPASATGLLDEVAIYDRDDQGRPSSDPGFFARALALSNGPDARGDGFDGAYLSPGYSVSEGVRVVSGILELPAGSSGVTPPYTIDPAGSSLRIRLSLGLVPMAVIRIVWDQAAEEEPAILELTGDETTGTAEQIDITLTPDGDLLRVITATPGSQGTESTLPLGSRDAIRVALENQADSESALAVDDIAIWPTR